MIVFVTVRLKKKGQSQYTSLQESQKKWNITYQHSGRTFLSFPNDQILIYQHEEWSSHLSPPWTLASGNARQQPRQSNRQRRQPEHVWAGWLYQYHLKNIMNQIELNICLVFYVLWMKEEWREKDKIPCSILLEIHSHNSQTRPLND